MNNSLIAVRYAKALFLLSKEKGKADNVYQDMNMLAKYCSGTEGFAEFLSSPVITPAKKKKALKLAFEKHANQLTVNFLSIMVDNKREALLDSIARNFIEFYKKERDIKSVTLFTASELGDRYLEKIRSMLQKELNSKIELTLRVRDNLIGGFILMVDGKMLDASVANKLKELKKQLLS